ncbi:MAG: type II toxin-antitoxin system VapC family toxin [Terriglobales bacterium]
MNKVVLDASAILAILNSEPGAEKLTVEILANAAASTVNLAEVQGKLVREGIEPKDAWELAQSPVREFFPFTTAAARTAGDLTLKTSGFGLSLGDRACLSLAMELGAPVYTADRAWKNLKLGIRVHVLR